MEAAMKLICATLLVIGIFFSTLVENTREGWSADYEKGSNAYVSGDYATALREWKPLAEQGFPPAQFNLGYLYRMGKAFPQDYKIALKWWKLAAEQGYAAAQGGLGFMYA